MRGVPILTCAKFRCGARANAVFVRGADIRELAALIREGGDWVGALRREYALHKTIAAYPKPVSVRLTGVTMGGGLGLAAASSRRVVDATARLAMPETKIGWFPDAGMRYFLSRAGAVGMHCALTSATFNGGDAIAMGIADETADGPLPTPLTGPDGNGASWIRECYRSHDPREIVHALEHHESSEARDAARDLRARSPIAVHVAARAMVLARSLSHAEVLDQDVVLSEAMLHVDFPEGVRALMIDKDNAPQWRYERIEDVPQSVVDSVFELTQP